MTKIANHDKYKDAQKEKKQGIRNLLTFAVSLSSLTGPYFHFDFL